MKNFIKTFFLTGFFFGLGMGVLHGLLRADISDGIFRGIILGIAFGLSMAISESFLSRKLKKMEQTIPNLIFSAGASHFAKGGTAGGWLFLTTTQLIFKSHKFNFNPHELIFELKDITSVQPSLTLGIIPNRLLILTATNKDRFGIGMYEMKNWVDKIMKAKADL
ncbi:MAG: GRAM domain-containing protein [Patescibacteria group bacterium]|nr:GRAM domain-containing protein [Patescibacteria group bacterium]